MMFVEHVSHRYLVSFQEEVSSSKKVSPMPHRFYYRLGCLLYGCMLQFTAVKSSGEEGNRFSILVEGDIFPRSEALRENMLLLRRSNFQI